jgi:hypothetical protein
MSAMLPDSAFEIVFHHTCDGADDVDHLLSCFDLTGINFAVVYKETPDVQNVEIKLRDLPQLIDGLNEWWRCR